METTETTETQVRKVEDTRVEVPSTYAENGYAASPLELRPGTDDGMVKVGGEVMQVKIADLREGLDLIEAENQA